MENQWLGTDEMSWVLTASDARAAVFQLMTQCEHSTYAYSLAWHGTTKYSKDRPSSCLWFLSVPKGSVTNALTVPDTDSWRVHLIVAWYRFQLTLWIDRNSLYGTVGQGVQRPEIIWKGVEWGGWVGVYYLGLVSGLHTGSSYGYSNIEFNCVSSSGPEL